MQSDAKTVSEYLDGLPEDRREAVSKIREVILKNLPEGFSEQMGGMIKYIVPLNRYPDGYHCNPKQPLPFISLASQKNFVALYHFAMYAHPPLSEWFTVEYPKHAKRKLDMGKSCVRFKKMDDIPYELIGQLAAKMSLKEWVGIYESAIKK